MPHGHSPALLRAWGGRVAWMCAALGWRDTALAERKHRSGCTLAFTAPPDALMAATALTEWALHASAVELDVPFDPASLDDDALPLDQSEALAALHDRVVAERASPPDDAAPIPDRAIPIALVTGSNGKTTTTRLIAAMLRAHGHTVGLTSTEGIRIGDETVERGDWSGPGGARLVLTDPRVTAAVLETARGGLLRRGLVVSRADVAVVTNVAADHFGNYGIHSLDDLAAVKTSVAHALIVRDVAKSADAVVGVDADAAPPTRSAGGTLVLNGDDPLLNPSLATSRLAPVARALAEDQRVTFSLEAPWPATLPPPEDIPIALGGTARFNLANALAAATAARALGVPDAVIATVLRAFGTDPADNIGRMMRLELGGLAVLVDYAHNPHGLAALLTSARALTRGNLILVLGQAGDRDDDAIRSLARTAWEARPSHVVLRDLDGFLRGREAGAVPAILREELFQQGARPEQVTVELDETSAVRAALAHAQRGDLIVLPVHALESRERVLQLLDALQATGWNAGDPLPEAQTP